MITCGACAERSCFENLFMDFRALTFITVLLAYFDINAWVQQNQFASVYIILIAVLVGVIRIGTSFNIYYSLYEWCCTL